MHPLSFVDNECVMILKGKRYKVQWMAVAADSQVEGRVMVFERL
jgi:hypothetical protein